MIKISYFRLFAACVYELLLLIALWFISAWIFIALFGDATHSYKRFFLQVFLWLVTGAYFVWCWSKSGQTLAAQTWKIKLVNQAGATLSVREAIVRYILASLSALVFGLGFVWIFVDKNQLYLHDRLLKSRFVAVNRN
ncbi:MAG: RDD family protein [Pseudomonadota bacterium]